MKIPRQQKIQTDLRTKDAQGTEGKKGASKAQKVQRVAKADEVDSLESAIQSGAPAPSSPLTDTVWRGLADLVEKYYGKPITGGEVGLRSSKSPDDVDIDKVVSPEVRAMKTDQLVRAGFGKAEAGQLVDAVAMLLAP